MSAAGDSASIAVGTGANAGRIMVGVAACGSPAIATVANTDTIVVNGTTGAETVTIDLSGGQFAPGARWRAPGSSEIEFVVDLSRAYTTGSPYVGGGQADTIVLGASGAESERRQRHRRRRLTGVELGTVTGSDGDDFFSGGGDARHRRGRRSST